MDRRTLSDRLPGDRIRRRLPVGRPGEDSRPDGDAAEVDGEYDDGEDDDAEDDGISIPDVDLPSGDDDSDRRLRTLLLALAGLGAIVTMVAVIAQFVLDRGSDEEDDEVDSPEGEDHIEDELDDAERADGAIGVGGEESEELGDQTDGVEGDIETDEVEAETEEVESDAETSDDEADAGTEESEPETVGDDEGFDEGTAAIVGLSFLLAVTAIRRWLDGQE